jgi:hypothetical protein
MPKFPMYFSELPAEDQKQLGRSIEILSRLLTAPKGRMKSYQDGDAQSGTVFRLIMDLRYASAMAAAMIDELIEKHGIPDAKDLRQIDEDLRSGMREALTRKPDGQ